MPNTLDNSTYKYPDWDGAEEISLTPEMWSNYTHADNLTSKDVYITIAESTTTFSLMTYF